MQNTRISGSDVNAHKGRKNQPQTCHKPLTCCPSRCPYTRRLFAGCCGWRWAPARPRWFGRSLSGSPRPADGPLWAKWRSTSASVCPAARRGEERRGRKVTSTGSARIITVWKVFLSRALPWSGPRSCGSAARSPCPACGPLRPEPGRCSAASWSSPPPESRSVDPEWRCRSRRLRVEWSQRDRR